jgi:hypothetical protein
MYEPAAIMTNPLKLGNFSFMRKLKKPRTAGPLYFIIESYILRLERYGGMNPEQQHSICLIGAVVNGVAITWNLVFLKGAQGISVDENPSSSLSSLLLPDDMFEEVIKFIMSYGANALSFSYDPSTLIVSSFNLETNRLLAPPVGVRQKKLIKALKR